ncbi:class I SAM-dependent methyltransferase [Candidatus Bathyarchaeota archaeon]|nr:MAG: class I SAM-dependent methyltransferase [Candidatus Bathyarchaeota archaeon]
MRISIVQGPTVEDLQGINTDRPIEIREWGEWTLIRGRIKHWTETLFVDHPELFLPWMEQMNTFAQPQVEGLRKIFQAHGVPSGGRILDLACGLGRISINLAKAGYEVVGVDISPLYLRLAQKWAKKESVDGKTIFYRIDARKATRLLASEEDRFDAVVNIGTSMGYYSFMRNSWKFYRRERNSLRLIADVPVSHRVYSLHELKALLFSAGWDYVESYGSLGELTPLTIDSFHMTVVSRRLASTSKI